VDPNAVLDSLDKRYKYLAPVWNRTMTYVTLAGSLAAVPYCVSVRCEEKRKEPQGMKRWQPSFNEPSPLDWNPMPFLVTSSGLFGWQSREGSNRQLSCRVCAVTLGL